MAQHKGSLNIGKNLNVADRVSINTGDTSETLTVAGTAKFLDVIVSSEEGMFSLPVSAGVSGQALFSRGNSNRLFWGDVKPFKSIVGVGAISVSSSPTELTLSAAPNPTSLSQLSNDQGFVSANQFVGSGIIQIRVSGTGAGRQIIVSAATTQVAVQSSALGGGSSIVIGTSANETRYRTLIGSGSIQISAGSNTVIVSAPVYNQVSAVSQLINDSEYVSAAQVNAQIQSFGFITQVSANNQFLEPTDVVSGGIIEVNQTAGGIKVSATGIKTVQSGGIVDVTSVNSTTVRVSATGIKNIQAGGIIEISNINDTTVKVSAPTYNPLLGGGQIISFQWNHNSNDSGNSWMRVGQNGLSSNEIWFIVPFDCVFIGAAYTNGNANSSCDVRLIYFFPGNNSTPGQSSVIHTHSVRFTRTRLETFNNSGINLTAGGFLGAYIKRLNGVINPKDPTFTVYFIVNSNSIINQTLSYALAGNLSSN